MTPAARACGCAPVDARRALADLLRTANVPPIDVVVRAADHGQRVSLATVTGLAAGRYFGEIHPRMLDAVAAGTGMLARDVYAAAGMSTDLLPFTVELPDQVDRLTRTERDQVLALIGDLLAAPAPCSTHRAAS